MFYLFVFNLPLSVFEQDRYRDSYGMRDSYDCVTVTEGHDLCGDIQLA